MSKKKDPTQLDQLWTIDPRDALRVGPNFDLAAIRRDATPGFSGDKKSAKKLMARRGELMAELQERLYAERKRSLLVVVQGLDTAGKGGIARHVISQVDPQGIMLTAFKAPTPQEREHHFLWRIRKRLPLPGYIGVFDRSHYEDFLVPAVSGSLEREARAERLREIADFEQEIVNGGTQIVKLALMVSYREQGLRLRERIDRPDKNWKYSPHDVDVRLQWDLYQRTYQEMLEHSSSDIAPWYLIPADNKWFARLAATELITRALAQMDPQWPAPTFDPQVERARVDATLSPEALAKYDSELAEKLRQAKAADAAINERASRLEV